MNDTFRRLLAGATRLTRSGQLGQATQAIQRALGGLVPPAAPATPRAAGEVIDIDDVRVVDEGRTEPAAAPVPPDRPRAGSFTAGQFANAAGARQFRLYVPPQAGSRPLPLIVMLHGCKQNAEDFAAGTRMNLLAQEAGCFVLYPAQSTAANGSGCWNWFREEDQHTGRGEPSILAEMTRQVMRSQSIDPARVYVAGLSAGGAMAATLAATYPDLFAAVGVHSGLPHRAAHDVASAFMAMSQGAQPRPAGARTAVPAIVFHGDRDTTVHACNGERVAAEARSAAGLPPAPAAVEAGSTAGGRRFTRTSHRDAQGAGEVEHWLVHGGGHAWFGGSPEGSYTDPSGPDASREMLRFFERHPKRAA